MFLLRLAILRFSIGGLAAKQRVSIIDAHSPRAQYKFFSHVAFLATARPHNKDDCGFAGKLRLVFALWFINVSTIKVYYMQ